MASNKIRISVIIPVLEINDYILKENLPAHAKITSKDFEVIVLPNELPDNCSRLKKQYPWLRIIPTHSITRPAQKRDIGAKNARGDILAFIDDDAYPTKTWMQKALKVFKEQDVAAVCGPGILPPDVNIWENVFDQILQSWVGNGGMEYRVVPRPARYVDDYPSMNLLVKKEVFDSIGGFNNNYWPGEDSKLCEDITVSYGGKIYYSPDVVIYHHRRQNLSGYVKQHGKYGFHRGAFFAQGDKNSRHAQYFVPSAFVIYLMSLIFWTVSSENIKTPLLAENPWIVWSPLGAYIILLCGLFISAYKNTRSLKVGILSIIVLFQMHVIYGIQFIRGTFRGLFHKNNIYGRAKKKEKSRH